MKTLATFIKADANLSEAVGSIRELKARQAASLAAHHKLHAELEAQIAAIRKKQGKKLKAPDYSGWHEAGRDRDPTRGW